MASIKEIYQWYDSIPRMPSGLTSLQQTEWSEQNRKTLLDIERRSFNEKILTSSPAIIHHIEIDKITAYATYTVDYSIDNKGAHHLTPGYLRDILEVQYIISYDKSIFYETLKPIYDGSMVELKGKILKFEKYFNPAYIDDYGNPVYLSYFSTTIQYKIQLMLSEIKVIEKQYLSAEQLSDKLKFKGRHPSTSGCFIATAAYGNQDITEVIQLRAFRDEILINSNIGRGFIEIYGLLSPPLAFIIKQSNWLRKLVRAFLKAIVLPFIKYRMINSINRPF